MIPQNVDLLLQIIKLFAHIPRAVDLFAQLAELIAQSIKPIVLFTPMLLMFCSWHQSSSYCVDVGVNAIGILVLSHGVFVMLGKGQLLSA